MYCKELLPKTLWARIRGLLGDSSSSLLLHFIFGGDRSVISLLLNCWQKLDDSHSLIFFTVICTLLVLLWALFCLSIHSTQDLYIFFIVLHELCLHLYWKPVFTDDQGVFSNLAGIIEWTLHTENVFHCSGLNWLVSWKLRCWYQWRDIQAIATGNSQRLEVYGCKFIGSFVLQFIFFSLYWVLTFLSIIFFFFNS